MKIHRLILTLIIGIIVIVTILALTLRDYLQTDKPVDVVVNECSVQEEIEETPTTLYPIKCMSNRFLSIESSVYINREGDIILSNDEWLYTGLFDENNLAIVTNEDYNSGVINKQGEFVVEPIYFHINYVGNKRYFLQTNEGVNYLATYENGDFNYLQIDYSWVFHYSEGLAAVKNEHDKIGFIDMNSNLVIDTVYDYNGGLNYQFTDGKVLLIYQNQYGVISKQKEILVSFEYDKIEKRHNSSYLRFQKNNLWGVMDADFNIIIEPIYKNIDAITDQLATVSKDGNLYAFLNIESNELVSDYMYYDMEVHQFVPSFNYFKHNYAVISLDGVTYNLINRNFDPLLNEGVNGIKIVDQERVLLYLEENKYILYNQITGHEILLEYEDVEIYPEFGIIAVSVESTFDGSTLFKLLNLKGEELFPQLIIYNNMDVRMIGDEKLLYFDGEYDGLMFSSYIDQELNIIWKPITENTVND